MSSAWHRFKQRYPKADLSKFRAEKFFDRDNVMFQGKDEETAVFDDNGREFRPSMYFSDEMKQALGLSGGFPLALTLNPHPKLPVPAVSFSDTPHPLGENLKRLKIYVTPTDHFTIPVRDIFKDTQITHRSGKEAHRWLAGPNMSYWPQQLNFALWCATTGCGVSQRLLFEDKMKDGKTDVTDSELYLPPQVRSVLWFHVYFTIRRVLYQLKLALPGDPTFNQTDNKYDVPSYERLCKEFGIQPNTNFRFEGGRNDGLGSVYIWVSSLGSYKTKASYPGYDKFSDEGGKASDGNLLQYIYNSDSANQYEYFVIPNSYGLTSAGQVRLNESIEALVYCILGAQVDVRTSILGDTGGAGEVKQQFIVKLEEIIKDTGISDNIVKFQNAIQASKVRLNFAVSPGTWLMPSRMVLNTEKRTGYNNNLKKTTMTMQLGVNNDINSETKSVGVKHMQGGKSKIHRPLIKPPVHSKESGADPKPARQPQPSTVTSTRQHEEIKIGIFAIIGTLAFGLAWYLR